MIVLALIRNQVGLRVITAIALHIDHMSFGGYCSCINSFNFCIALLVRMSSSLHKFGSFRSVAIMTVLLVAKGAKQPLTNKQLRIIIRHVETVSNKKC